MVVDLAVVDDGAGEADAVGGAVVLAADDIGFGGDEVPWRDGVEDGWGEGVDGAAGAGGAWDESAVPCWGAVVGEVGEVRLFVVRVGDGDGGGGGVLGGDAVADEPAVDLDGGGDGDGPDAVACGGIAVGAAVIHGEGRP